MIYLIIAGFLIILTEVYKMRVFKTIDLITMINGLLLLAYIVAPIYIQNFVSEDFIQAGSFRWILSEDIVNFNHEYVGMIILVFTIIMELIFFLQYKLSYLGQVKVVTIEYREKLLDILSIITLIFGTVFMLYYMEVVGGVLFAIRNASALRSGLLSGSSSFLFLKNLAIIILSASYIRFYMCLKKTTKINIAVFLISVIISLLYLYLRAGRLSIFLYLLAFPFALLFLNKRYKLRYIIATVFVGMFLVVFGDFAFKFFSDYHSNSFNLTGSLNQLLLEYSFPYFNIPVAHNYIAEHNLLLGKDIITAITNFLPNDLFHISEGTSVSTINSINVDVQFTVPVDIITMSIYDLGRYGFMFYSVLFAISISIINWVAKVVNKDNSIFVTANILFIAFTVLYAAPTLMIFNGLEIFVMNILLLATIKKIKVN
jgi:hypothetical protein